MTGADPTLLASTRRSVVALFVDRPVTTLMALCAIVLIGAIALQRLPLRFTPDGLTENEINVWVPVPGDMAPQEVQDKVLDPLVAMVRTVPGLQRIRTPIGLDLGGQSAAEIALSILGEIVAARNGRSGGSLRERRREAPHGEGRNAPPAP